MKAEYCHLWLTCSNKQEADKIANTLLVKHLIACAKQVPVSSDFRWQGKIGHAEEVLLVMESRLDLFTEIEREVVKFHSFDTFVLEATPIVQLSAKATRWLEESLSDK